MSAAARCLLTEDQFLCSICLRVFTDPVSTPCGHNFCKTCISQHWDIHDQCRCPYCNRVFNTRPEMRVNIFISEMAAQFRQSAKLKPGEVPSFVSSGTKRNVWMFCLMCLMGFIVWHVLDPRTRDVVPLKKRYEGKKAELQKMETEIQQMIQKRRLKIEEIKHSVELSKEGADREIADGVQVFTALKEELIDKIEEKHRRKEEEAEGFIKELEQEVSELEKKSSEVEQLSMAMLEETLSKKMKKEMKKLLRRVQQSAVDLTLDPDTVHPYLILSDDGKQVNLGDVGKDLPDNPERFDYCVNVLTKQSFSSGRFYFEVQVKGKTEWDLGVVRESINRKGKITVTPQNGYWTILLRNENEYDANADPAVRLSLKSRPEKVGVFVDYEEGLVSFYDVDAAALIYSFTGSCFTEKLYPFFGPGLNRDGKNSAPLIITPVSHTK